MVWDPKFKLIPVTRFIDNIAAYIVLHQAELVTWACTQANVTPVLPEFQYFRRARQVNDKWPVLNLLAAGGDPTRSADGARIDEVKRVILEAETIDRVADTLASMLPVYVLMLNSVGLEMPKDKLVEGIPQQTRRGGITVEVSSERYSERFYQSENQYTQVGSILLTIGYKESR